MTEKKKKDGRVGPRKPVDTRNYKRKWAPLMLVHIYKMAKVGLTEKEIARNLKPPIRPETLVAWKREHPEIITVLEMARKEREGTETFQDWVYSRLSPELQKLWKKINTWEKQDGGVKKIELMLQEEGKHVRQQLFLYALCSCNFSQSQALRKVNVSKQELDRWIATDLGFAELITEMDWHKGNFFEEALVNLISQGDTAAVLFANKTYNAERGYAPHSKLDVNVQGRVLHGVFDLVQILPLLSETCKAEVMGAIRSVEEKELDKVLPKRLTVQERLELEIQEVAGKVVLDHAKQT